MNTDLLLKGLHQINQWRLEINQVVKTLLGLLDEVSLDEPKRIWCNEEKTCYWLLVLSQGSRLSVIFVVITQPGNVKRHIYDSDRMLTTSLEISIDQVYTVRSKLDILIVGLCSIFSRLENELQPLLTAAGVVDESSC